MSQGTRARWAELADRNHHQHDYQQRATAWTNRPARATRCKRS